MNIGDNIKKIRQQLGLTQANLSLKMGYASKVTVSDWEKGKTQPKISDILTLSNLANVPTDYVIKGIVPDSILTCPHCGNSISIKLEK